MRKIAFTAVFSLVVCSLTACSFFSRDRENGSGTVPTGDAMSSGPYLEIPTSSEPQQEFDVRSAQSSSGEPTEAVDSAGVRTIRMEASNWAFTPDVVKAKKGERVKLEIVAVSGSHGFAVPELNMNVRINEGQTAMVTLPTDQAGRFDAFCSVPCGVGHKGMKATIVIE